MAVLRRMSALEAIFAIAGLQTLPATTLDILLRQKQTFLIAGQAARMGRYFGIGRRLLKSDPSPPPDRY
jgi:hypothetical protein